MFRRGGGVLITVCFVCVGFVRFDLVKAAILGQRDFALAQQGYADDEDTALQAHYTNSAPAIADIDGDGQNELIVLASVQNASQVDRFKGVALWVLRPDGTRHPAWTEPLHYPNYLAT